MANNHVDVLKKLMPLSLGDDFNADLELKGQQLDNARDRALTLVDEFFPDTATLESIPLWERMLGLTPSATDTLQNRRDAATAQARAQGGSSKPYFISVLTAFIPNAFASVDITEYAPLKAGIMKAGDKVFGEDVVFAWDVEMLGWTGNIQQSVIENLINKLKPAHTIASFTYS